MLNNINFYSEYIEPIFVGKKYYGIKLMSVYDSIICVKTYENLIKDEVFESLEENISKEICSQASVVCMCLYTSGGEKVFSEALDVIKKLSPYEMQTIYNEYKSMRDKIIHKNKVFREILHNTKKYYKNLK